MSNKPTLFGESTARIIVDMVRERQRIDPRNSKPGRRYNADPSQAADFIIARITEVDSSALLQTASAVQVYAQGTSLIDMPNGVLFDKSNAATTLTCPTASLRVDQIVTCWIFGTSWFALPLPVVEWWGEITANSADGSNKWTYTVEERKRDSDGWSAADPARSVEGVLNSVEANNSGSGVQGNGVDVDSDIFSDNTSLAIQPAATGAVVRVVEDYIRNDDGGITLAHSFSYVNAVDGECG